MLLRLGIGLVLALLVIYGAIEAWPLVRGPVLTINSPQNGQTFGDGAVIITGTTHHTETLSLNGSTLLMNEAGHFETTLLLPRGSAILSLNATDRFGRSTTLRRTVFVP